MIILEQIHKSLSKQILCAKQKDFASLISLQEDLGNYLEKNKLEEALTIKENYSLKLLEECKKMQTKIAKLLEAEQADIKNKYRETQLDLGLLRLN